MSQETAENPPYMDQALDLEQRVEDLLKRLTFEEKCMLSAGEGDNCPPAIERLGIKRFGMTDGPHGVSPYKTGVGPNGVQIETEEVGTSTYFPTGIQIASTWNLELAYKFGEALAEETRAVGRYMQLGPAMNICRNPMNGRTFEYYSEDPLLSGEIGAQAVKGMQSRRIAPCVKHYVANNFETNRFKVNVNIGRRALEEIYLAGFKRCVQKSNPWGIMSAYNKINGVYVSEHKGILREKLKDEFGFTGVVVSDWGATNHTTGIKGLVEAGLDIEMGSRRIYNIAQMVQMKNAGEFPEQYFEDNVRRILRAMFRAGLFDDPKSLPPGSINTPEHQAVARKLAEEGMILLKNDKNTLPLDLTKVKKIAILGKHADTKFGRKKLGGGSSAVYPPYEITIREGITKKCQGKIEVVTDPAQADVAIVCVGLEHSHDFKGGDHEGSDRLRYGLGFLPNKLIKSTVKANPNTIVIFVNGQPFDIEPFVSKVPAILEAWYGGMEIGAVVADILFGDVNPSGKLPVSWYKRKGDIHTALSFLNTIIPIKEVDYSEGIFIGYRYFDTYKKEPRFCFGHGLSYTTFSYSNLSLSSETLKVDGKIDLSFKLTNTGDRDGAEICQLYLKNHTQGDKHPDKELRGFQKIFLKAKESKQVTFSLSKQELLYFSEAKNQWVADAGDYEILLGKSSRDLPLSKKFKYTA